jgi:hypothetical protein
MRRVGELHALSVSSECYRMDPGGRSIYLHPNPSFLPTVLSDRHVNIPFIPSAYDPLLRHAVAAYVERTQSVRTDQLFVCYDERVLGAVLSNRKLSHWIEETITTAYRLAGICGGTFNTRCWCVLGSTARSALADICAAASWASSWTFARYYRVNVAPPSAVGSVVLGVRGTPLPQ